MCLCVCEEVKEWWCMDYLFSSFPTCTHQDVCIATVPPWGYKSTGNSVTHQMSRKVFKGVASRASLD